MGFCGSPPQGPDKEKTLPIILASEVLCLKELPSAPLQDSSLTRTPPASTDGVSFFLLPLHPMKDFSQTITINAHHAEIIMEALYHYRTDDLEDRRLDAIDDAFRIITKTFPGIWD